MTHEYEQQLQQIVSDTPWLRRALVAVRSIRLRDWCIGGGAIRNAVWDALHGYKVSTHLADIDVAYFDARDVSREHDDTLELELALLEPDLPWDVTNQAGVHEWFEGVFGHSVEPLVSLEDAVATWPETATSVAVTLTDGGGLNVIAPLGLPDLFGMVVRRNPRRVSLETYRKRVAEKRYTERWPRVRTMP